MKTLILAITIIGLFACHSARRPQMSDEKIPDIAGTWLQDGNIEKPCYIVQNGRDLIFLSGNETSEGYFKSSMEVFATGWNRNAILSNDYQSLKWADRRWVKTSFTVADISGTWYENAEAGKRIVVSQDGNKLVMDNGSQKLNAYFYATNAVYCIENNNYAVYAPDKNTLTWGTKTWTRNPKG